MLEWLLIGAFTEISDWVDHQARYYKEKNSLVIKRRQEFVTTAKQRQEVCDATDKTIEREHQVVFKNVLSS